MNHKLKALIIILILASIIGGYLNYNEDFTFDNLKENKEEISEFVDKNYIVSVIIFFILAIIIINTPIPLAATLKVLGGFVFGFGPGVFYNIAATTLSACIGLTVTRKLYGEYFQKKYHKLLEKTNKEVEKNGFFYFLFLRLGVVFPFFIIHILGGLSKISRGKYFWSTLIGVIPASIIYAYTGNKLMEVNSLRDFFTTEVILIIILLIILAALPLIIRNIIELKKRNKKEG